MEHHSVDIQWGNHDVYWMGAASGSAACICNVIRISAKYGNLDLLEDGYGINLVPLARFAMKWYDKDSCDCFKLDYREDEYDVHDAFLDEKMHKAITIMPVSYTHLVQSTTGICLSTLYTKRSSTAFALEKSMITSAATSQTEILGNTG